MCDDFDRSQIGPMGRHPPRLPRCIQEITQAVSDVASTMEDAEHRKYVKIVDTDPSGLTKVQCKWCIAGAFQDNMACWRKYADDTAPKVGSLKADQSQATAHVRELHPSE